MADGASPEIQRRVLRVLCDRYPNVFASVRDHAEKADLCIRSVQKGLRALEYKGLIARVEVPGDDGWRPRQYKMNVSQIMEASEAKDRICRTPRGAPGAGVTRMTFVGNTNQVRDSHERDSGVTRTGCTQTEQLREKEKSNITKQHQQANFSAPPKPQGGIDDDDANHSPSLLKTAPDGAAAPAPLEPEGLAATGPGTPVAGFDRSRFIAALRGEFKEAEFPFKVTQKHLDAAAALAEQYDSEIVRAAASLWLGGLMTDDPNCPVVIGFEKPDSDGYSKPILKTYILNEFIQSGAAEEYIQKILPYRGLSDEALLFLVDDTQSSLAPIDPGVLTLANGWGVKNSLETGY